MHARTDELYSSFFSSAGLDQASSTGCPSAWSRMATPAAGGVRASVSVSVFHAIGRVVGPRARRRPRHHERASRYLSCRRVGVSACRRAAGTRRRAFAVERVGRCGSLAGSAPRCSVALSLYREDLRVSANFLLMKTSKRARVTHVP
jgi:hypothetical protein